MWSIFLLCAVCAVCAVCATNLNEEYQNSLNDWNILKAENNDCYTYTVITFSFVGFGSTTTITVEDGIVISRSYEAFDSNGNITNTYKEFDNVIGSNSDGAAPKTMDELYAECPTYLSQDPSTNHIFFVTNSDNIMTTCSYSPILCAGDCSQGISISSIQFCPSTNLEAYQNSLNIWNSLRSTEGDCYTYTSTYVSSSEFGSTTTITVADGVVVQRSYQEFDY